jgi:cytochrome c553
MRNVLKWIGILLGGLLVAALIAVVAIYFITESRLNETYAVSVTAVEIPQQPELGERKYPLVVVDLCRDCHRNDLAGQVMDDDPLTARLVAANLTAGKGGIGGEYTPEDWVRAIRHGIGRDGKSLIVMPSSEMNILSDTDLGIVISLIKSTPPIDNDLPEIYIGPMGRIFLLQEPYILPASVIDHNLQSVQMPEPGVTVEYGEYLAHLCALCHGKDFAGLDTPGGGLNLTPAGYLGGWTETDFIETMRTGIAPDGVELDQEMMPVGIWGKLSDDELKAIWMFLQTLPPVETPATTPAE